MEFVLGAVAVVIIVVMGLQAMAIHQAREVCTDLTRQLKRKEGDLAELAHKNKALREEIDLYPLVYTKPAAKPPAIHVTQPARRREDLTGQPRPQGWDNSWGDL